MPRLVEESTELRDIFEKFNTKYFLGALRCDVIMYSDKISRDGTANCAQIKSLKVDGEYVTYHGWIEVTSRLKRKNLSRLRELTVLHEMSHLLIHAHSKEWKALRLVLCAAYECTINEFGN